MGLIRFLVPPPSDISANAHERAFATGIDQVPWRCEVRRQGDEIQIVRSVNDSGNFHIPWEVDGYGELMIGTATLREREKPYHLQVELARGKLNQVRNQIAEWQSIGLAVPQRRRRRAHRAVGHRHPDQNGGR